MSQAAPKCDHAESNNLELHIVLRMGTHEKDCESSECSNNIFTHAAMHYLPYPIGSRLA